MIINCKRNCHCYRPQQSCGQINIFTPVCHSVHGGGVLPQSMLGYQPPRTRHPPRSRYPPPRANPPGPGAPSRTRHPPGADSPPRHPPDHAPPRSRHPQSRLPLEPGTPPSRHPPALREADSSIRSTSGRYASYWNAFLLFLVITVVVEFFSQTYKIGINANFVFPYICSFLLYLYQIMLVNVKLDISRYKSCSIGILVFLLRVCVSLF